MKNDVVHVEIMKKLILFIALSVSLMSCKEVDMT